MLFISYFFFFFSSRRRHTRLQGDWSSDVCSSDLSPLTRDSNYTTGQIYQSVINKERRGEFLGKTVQVIPHITNEIKGVIQKLAGPDVDVVITEIGGTVGDIESQPFLEAIRPFAP